MTTSQLPALLVLSPLLGSFFVVLLALRSPGRARTISLVSVGLGLLACLGTLARTRDGNVLLYAFGSWAAPYGIEYRVDGLAACVATLVGGTAFVSLFFAAPTAARELRGREAPFFAFLCLFVAALEGMIVTGDLFNLYVFLEITALSAYTLVAAGGPRSVVASFRYLVLGTLGATFYLLGLAFLLATTGTLNMADMAELLRQRAPDPALAVAVTFVVAGLGLKMALFPLHGWLPDAYTYAPSASAPFLAALTTKVAAFALFRVLFGVLWPAIEPYRGTLTFALGWLAVAGVLGGSVMALVQHKTRRLLAYSSVSHLGMIAMGLALANPLGLAGALLHILAHGLGKGGLFLATGAVEFRREGGRVEDFRSASHDLPLTTTSFTLCALSLVGLPPTLGFFSKWYLLLGALEARRYSFAVALLAGSLLGIWYFFRVLEGAYFGKPTPEVAKLRPEVPLSILLPTLLLAASVLVLGFLVRPLMDHWIVPSLGALRLGTAAGAP
ncbi:MAG: cation:proton antiporter [Candidatus Binatia bacterium]|nr:MAG: cation:proton antiporter [Candidatus Binatia bacterium]